MNLRRYIIASLLLLSVKTAIAAPCVQVRVNPELWVTRSVNTLIRNAKLAFDDEKGLPAYHRTVKGLASTINQCRLNENSAFSNRYPEFLKYVAVLALIQRTDHEL